MRIRHRNEDEPATLIEALREMVADGDLALSSLQPRDQVVIGPDLAALCGPMAIEAPHLALEHPGNIAVARVILGTPVIGIESQVAHRPQPQRRGLLAHELAHLATGELEHPVEMSVTSRAAAHLHRRWSPWIAGSAVLIAAGVLTGGAATIAGIGLGTAVGGATGLSPYAPGILRAKRHQRLRETAADKLGSEIAGTPVGLAQALLDSGPGSTVAGQNRGRYRFTHWRETFRADHPIDHDRARDLIDIARVTGDERVITDATVLDSATSRVFANSAKSKAHRWMLRRCAAPVVDAPEFRGRVIAIVPGESGSRPIVEVETHGVLNRRQVAGLQGSLAQLDVVGARPHILFARPQATL